MSPLKLALLARQARERSEAALRADPIAVIGMGCRLPGNIEDPEAFWALLRDGIDAVREIPADRWDVRRSYDPDPSVPGKTATRCGGFLDSIDGFDAGFFGVPAREAQRMDPQQRLFLEVAIEALDDAGLPRERLAGSRTGAFVASYYNDYAHLQHGDPLGIDARTLTGTVHSVLVNRLSYLLDLKGPSVSIDTACSSSLVAVHLACQSLRHGESDIALAGGVSLIVGESQMIALSKVGFMSPDGRCKTFDASADGFGRGEGCGVVVLKRLSDAVADGDRVMAVIRGSAVNQDGRSTVLAAPNGLAQKALILEALSNAQMEPHQIGYVEAHGTGTALGDPIEVEAIAATIGRPSADAGPCLLGSAKANLAHLEAAAGVTGLIKSVLILRHDAVPPQVHFRSLNPHISLAGTRLKIPTSLMPWPRGDRARCIGTSGFGVGGTNAHVILQEAPQLPEDPECGHWSPAPWLLPMSAQSARALQALARKWIEFLSGPSEVDLPAVCATAGERRSHFEHRLAVVGRSKQEMISRLRAFVDGATPAGLVSDRRDPSRARRVAFVFGGQGQQWIGMGRELIESEPEFARQIGAIDGGFRGLAGWSLLDELAAPAERSRLNETEFAQPAIFAIQVCLAAVWAKWGIRPDAVVGHSVGEIAALHVSGVLDLEEALRIVTIRATEMQRATGAGAMATCALDQAHAEARISRYGHRLSVAAVNGPTSVVLSGEREALAEVLDGLVSDGVQHKVLPVNYAFHSAQMNPFAESIRQRLGVVRALPERIPVYSTVFGRRLGDPNVGAEYFAQNVRSAVRFADAIDAMLEDGFDTFVELSATPVVAGSILECAQERSIPAVCLASMRRERPQRETLLLACGALYARGIAPNWPGLQGAFARVIDLPSYPWQRERHWIRPASYSASRDRSLVASQGILGSRIDAAGDAVFESRWPGAAPDWLAHHRIGGRLLVPAAAMLEAIRRAGMEVLGLDVVEVTDFVVRQPLVLDESGERETVWQLVASLESPGSAIGRLYRRIDDRDVLASPPWVVVASARIAAGEEGRADDGDGDACLPAGEVDLEALNASFESIGVAFGPVFRTCERLWLREGGGGAWLSLAESAGADGELAHPALLDGALQVCVAAAGGGRAGVPLLPMAVDRFLVWHSLPRRVRVEVKLGSSISGGSLVADAKVLDEDGRLLAVVDGARFVPAEPLVPEPAADPWLHMVNWHTVEGASPAAQDGRWIVLADDGGCGAAIAKVLGGRQGQCTIVHRGAAIEWNDSGIVRIDPEDELHWKALFSGAGRCDDRPVTGVLHLWSLDDPESGAEPTPVGDEAFAARDLLGTRSGLLLVRELARRADGASPQIVFATRGAQAAEDAVARPAAAGLWGLASVVAAEHPEFSVRVLDMDPDAPVDIGALAAELERGRDGRSRLAFRAGRWLEPRLEHRVPRPEEVTPAVLRPGPSGTLEALAWQPSAVPAPGPGEVTLRTVAAGLNFRDVLMALGMIPSEALFFGAECAGVVIACGSEVDLQVGDRVIGFAPGALATVVNVRADFLVPWASEFGSLEVAAAQPVAFLTAMLGLQRLADVRAGQQVLIHSAAGGVGLAAMQLALKAGACVHATAGTSRRRALLRSLGAAYTYDSRTVDFAAKVRANTGGRGVDIVLNSLAGGFIAASVEALAEDGCFLELGKRDVWSADRFASQRPAARYHVYDLGRSAAQQPEIVRGMLNELQRSLKEGVLRPLPVRVYGFENVSQAMRLMSRAGHVGKVVLRAPPVANRAIQPLRTDATYLVTGGLGAIGLRTAGWLVKRGARHLLLTGRSAPSADALATIDALRGDGIDVRVEEVDAADADAMRALLASVARNGLPLRGVVHAAGRLDDGVLAQQDDSRLMGVLRGKAHGARVLDSLTRGLPLDFFVLYSAAGLLLGPPGQGPYAAANAELDAIAHARRARGLPALSVAWGMWSGGGMAAAMAEVSRGIWDSRGLGWIEPDAGFDRLERLLAEGDVHAAVLPIDWSRFLANLPPGIDPAFFRGLAAPQPVPVVSSAVPVASSPAERWRRLPQTQQRSAVLQFLTAHALSVLGLDSSAPLDPRRALKEAGLDSLMAVELRNLYARELRTPLPATLLFDHPTLDSLTGLVMKRIGLLASQEEVVSIAVGGERDRVAGLSDEEAEALLLAELAADGASRSPS